MGDPKEIRFFSRSKEVSESVLPPCRNYLVCVFISIYDWYSRPYDALDVLEEMR